MVKTIGGANLQHLLGRISSDHPAAAKIKAAVGEAHAIAAAMADRSDTLKRGGTLTPSGHRQAMRDALEREFGPLLRKAREPLTKLRIEAAAKRKRIGFDQLDRTDVVGEMQRQELRAHLRSLQTSERTQIALTTKDKLMRQAIASAPPALSGLTDDMHGRAVRGYLQDAFGPQFAEVEALESVVAEGEAIADIARVDLQTASGLEARQFAAVMAPLEARPLQMWRSKNVTGEEQVMIHDADKGARQATPDEQLVGEIFDTADAYRAALARTGA